MRERPFYRLNNMKQIILSTICILFFGYNLFAEMPTIIGYGEFNDKPYRDNIYNWLVAKSSNCTNKLIIETGNYTVVPGSASAYYAIRVLMHYPLAKLSERTEVKMKIQNVRDNVKTTKLKMGIYSSNNDGIPGICQPDIIDEWILKGY